MLPHSARDRREQGVGGCMYGAAMVSGQRAKATTLEKPPVAQMVQRNMTVPANSSCLQQHQHEMKPQPLAATSPNCPRGDDLTHRGPSSHSTTPTTYCMHKHAGNNQAT
jgi:hypothetical protein